MEDRSRIYMAASVPRSIRTARLSHLPLQAIIGCWFTKTHGDLNFVFDVIMLPVDQFNRTKSYLAVPDMSAPSLQMLKFAPPYVVKDAKSVTVPADETNPYQYAKAHFMRLFNLNPPQREDR